MHVTKILTFLMVAGLVGAVPGKVARCGARRSEERSCDYNTCEDIYDDLGDEIYDDDYDDVDDAEAIIPGPSPLPTTTSPTRSNSVHPFTWTTEVNSTRAVTTTASALAPKLHTTTTTKPPTTTIATTFTTTTLHPEPSGPSPTGNASDARPSTPPTPSTPLNIRSLLPFSQYCNSCFMYNGHTYDPHGHLLRCDCQVPGRRMEWQMAEPNKKLANQNGEYVWKTGKYRDSCTDYDLLNFSVYSGMCEKKDRTWKHTQIDLGKYIKLNPKNGDFVLL